MWGSDKVDDRNAVRDGRTDLCSDSLLGLADNLEFALVIIDAQGRVRFVNAAAESTFGYDTGEMLGHTLDLIIPQRLRGAHEAGFRRVAAGGAPRLNGRTVEVTAVRRNGEEFPIELSLAVWQGADGVEMGGMIRDISERRQRDQRLHRLAHHDALTGLGNRNLFNERLVQALAGQALAGRNRSAVFLIGLDGFKTVNDSLGHTTGDSLLQALAVRLAGLLDPQAVLARFGADEFAALLPDMADRETADRSARAILDAFSAPFKVGDHLVPLNVSVGCALAPDHATNAEELVARADLATQAAKRTRGGFCMFEPAMLSATVLRRIMKDELRDAVERKEFELYYQPQVHINDGIVGAEALIRWNHPRRGLLAPAAFLPILENHTLALATGCWILDEACRQAAIWRRCGRPDFHVAVNLFSAQVDAGNLVEVVTETLTRHGLPPEALEIEVTETITLDRDEKALAPFRALRDKGVRIAFDDFGTGHASLATVRQFPLTTLKIDRSFVRELPANRRDAAIVRMLLTMGRETGLHVIAEGVETQVQEESLRAMRCVLAQGYLYSRPVRAGEFERLLFAPPAKAVHHG